MTKNKQNIIAIIIARGGSKSIPRKNLFPLHGKPLVAWPIDLAKSVNRIDKVIVTTDDDEIADIAKKYGAEVPFKRPAELSHDETPTLPVLQHAITYLEKEENYQADIILLLYPTSPFLKKERVEEAIDLFETTDCNSVISVVEDWGRFWKKDNGKQMLLHPKNRVNRQYYKPLLRENGAIYFSKRDILIEQNKLVDDTKIQFLVMQENENIDIDNPEDLEEAQKRNK